MTAFRAGKTGVLDENRFIDVEYRGYEETEWYHLRGADEAIDFHYYCTKCDLEFHSECYQFPSKMIHPYHPQHPLTFTFLNYETGIMADTSFREFYHAREICGDSEKQCDACIRPVGSHDHFYSCIECEFLLHEFPSGSPIKVINNISYSSPILQRLDEILCQGCKGSIRGDHLHCTLCEFAICYKCATIPDEIYHKYDEHPLSLCYGKSGVDEDEVWWCEVCEKRLDPRNGSTQQIAAINVAPQSTMNVYSEILLYLRLVIYLVTLWKLLVTIVALVPFVVSVIAVADILYTSNLYTPKCIVGTVGAATYVKKLRFFVLFFVSQTPLCGAQLFTNASSINVKR
ncbi:unnamed protein product [Microthlaspi erraticum]|uniref:Uncharacterized protein n=1 Tax=Microthlaspi erraticum TaxID=1685480 RepID=A0A6D2KIN5_9BRAS|nr:unnamed protein product [Microthlaspi erraticum]